MPRYPKTITLRIQGGPEIEALSESLFKGSATTFVTDKVDEVDVIINKCAAEDNKRRQWNLEGVLATSRVPFTGFYDIDCQNGYIMYAETPPAK